MSSSIPGQQQHVAPPQHVPSHHVLPSVHIPQQRTPLQQDAFVEDDDPTQATQDMPPPHQGDYTTPQHDQQNAPAVHLAQDRPCNVTTTPAVKSCTAPCDFDAVLRTSVMEPLTQQVVCACGAALLFSTTQCNHPAPGGSIAGHHQVYFRVCQCCTAIHPHTTILCTGNPGQQCSRQPTAFRGIWGEEHICVHYFVCVHHPYVIHACTGS